MECLSNNLLKSNRVMLRPVTSDDYSSLFKMHANAENLYLWWNDRYILDYDTFANDFRGRLRSWIDCFFVIEKLESDAQSIIGMVYSYKVSHIDKYAYICLYLVPDYTAKGFGPEVGILFCNYIFRTFGFRKIYTEVLDYNTSSLKVLNNFGFRKEGVLKDYHWFGERYWDMQILSVTRDDFMSLVDNLSGNCT